MRAAQRREHLLDTAAAMILGAGFQTLTMEGLAQRAGVSKGLGYVYFANADEIALALHDREVAQLYGRIEAATVGTASFEEKVRRAVGVLFDTVAERGILLGVLQSKLSGRRRHRSVRQRIAGFVGFWARLIGEEFDLSPAAAEAVAGATLSAADALTRAWSARMVGRQEVEALCAAFIVGGVRAAAATLTPPATVRDTPARRRRGAPGAR